MENRDERRTEMIAQAKAILSEIHTRESMAHQATFYVTAILAHGLREQGLTDKAIGETLSVSRNRVNDLVKAAIWPELFDGVTIGDHRQREFLETATRDTYRPIAQPSTGWIHTITGRSGDIATANNIPLPRHFHTDPAELETEGAQFDNHDTGERILVYTLERHHGKPLFDSEMQCVGYDFIGHYRIDIFSVAGDRNSLPLEHLGITETALRFGAKWPLPTERRDSGDAFRNAMKAVRHHYGIWPLPDLSERDTTYWTS
jgi:predicted XRE-type DNA-binding protein